MPRLKRKERLIEQTRRHILAAAARVFASKSFANASMQEIASEAGFSPASLYAYFDGKQALIRALAETIRQEVDTLLRRPLPESLSFRQRLELMLLRQCEWIEAHEHDYLVLAREERFRVALEEVRPGVTPAQVAALIDWMVTHASPEDLGTAGPEEAAWLLWSIMRGAIARWVHGNREVRVTAGVPRIASLFLYGVLGSAEATEESEGHDGGGA